MLGSRFGTPLTAEPMAAKAVHYRRHPRKGIDQHEINEAGTKQMSEGSAEVTGGVALVDHVLDGSDEDLDEQQSKEESERIWLESPSRKRLPRW